MKWPWKKGNEIEVPEDNVAEAQQARLKSERDLAKAKEKGKEVKRIARSLDDIRKRNHLAEQLRQALGGH